MKLHTIALSLVISSAHCITQAIPKSEKEYNERFFDVSKWNEDEKDRLFDTLIAMDDVKSDMILDKAVKKNSKKIRGRQPRRLDEGEESIDIEKLKAEIMLEEAEAFEEFVAQKDEITALDMHEDDDEITALDNHYGHKGSKSKKGGSAKGSKSSKSSKSKKDSDDGAVCPDPDSTGLPCPDPMLSRTCDKYDLENGDFKECFDMCTASFCCIHDSKSKTVAPSCSKTEMNCRAYSPCYILWWKLTDTVGTAPYFYVSQGGDDFFPEFDDYIDTFSDEFLNQLLGHHFDDDVVSDSKFDNQTNW